MSEKCKHVYFDGAGHYCKLILPPDSDYPHKHWRVMCRGDINNWACEAKKRGLVNCPDCSGKIGG